MKFFLLALLVVAAGATFCTNDQDCANLCDLCVNNTCYPKSQTVFDEKRRFAVNEDGAMCVCMESSDVCSTVLPSLCNNSIGSGDLCTLLECEQMIAISAILGDEDPAYLAYPCLVQNWDFICTSANTGICPDSELYCGKFMQCVNCTSNSTCADGYYCLGSNCVVEPQAPTAPTPAPAVSSGVWVILSISIGLIVVIGVIIIARLGPKPNPTGDDFY